MGNQPTNQIPPYEEFKQRILATGVSLSDNCIRMLYEKVSGKSSDSTLENYVQTFRLTVREAIRTIEQETEMINDYLRGMAEVAKGEIEKGINELYELTKKYVEKAIKEKINGLDTRIRELDAQYSSRIDTALKQLDEWLKIESERQQKISDQIGRTDEHALEVYNKLDEMLKEAKEKLETIFTNYCTSMGNDIEAWKDEERKNMEKSLTDYITKKKKEYDEVLGEFFEKFEQAFDEEKRKLEEYFVKRQEDIDKAQSKLMQDLDRINKDFTTQVEEVKKTMFPLTNYFEKKCGEILKGFERIAQLYDVDITQKKGRAEEEIKEYVDRLKETAEKAKEEINDHLLGVRNATRKFYGKIENSHDTRTSVSIERDETTDRQSTKRPPKV